MLPLILAVVGGYLVGDSTKDKKVFAEGGYIENKQKLINSGYSDSDSEDFADEFEQGGNKVPQKVKDILGDDGIDNYKKNMHLVTVKFKNPKYNYTTNVSGGTDEADIRKYFVGQYFNVGKYPRENMQKCIDIEFKEKGTYADGGVMADGGFNWEFDEKKGVFKSKVTEGRDYVAVGEKGGYWSIISKPSKKQQAMDMLSGLTLPKGEVGKVVTVEQAMAHDKVIGRKFLTEYAEGGIMANGGNLNFQ